jgi:hypothetical protein
MFRIAQEENKALLLEGFDALFNRAISQVMRSTGRETTCSTAFQAVTR